MSALCGSASWLQRRPRRRQPCLAAAARRPCPSLARLGRRLLGAWRSPSPPPTPAPRRRQGAARSLSPCWTAWLQLRGAWWSSRQSKSWSSAWAAPATPAALPLPTPPAWAATPSTARPAAPACTTPTPPSAQSLATAPGCRRCRASWRASRLCQWTTALCAPSATASLTPCALPSTRLCAPRRTGRWSRSSTPLT